MSTAIRLHPAALWRCACGQYWTATVAGCAACGAKRPAEGQPIPAKPLDGAGGCAGRPAPFGRCPHTGRRYRSKTEVRWATAHPEHRYEALAIATPCGVYWPDFYEPTEARGCLYEVKGAWIRDRALHKVKAAIRPARALGFAGIWLAVWSGGEWKASEIKEG